jgi:hypothetical protein
MFAFPPFSLCLKKAYVWQYLVFFPKRQSPVSFENLTPRGYLHSLCVWAKTFDNFVSVSCIVAFRGRAIHTAACKVVTFTSYNKSHQRYTLLVCAIFWIKISMHVYFMDSKFCNDQPCFWKLYLRSWMRSTSLRFILVYSQKSTTLPFLQILQ